jgi:hypothetical protein
VALAASHAASRSVLEERDGTGPVAAAGDVAALGGGGDGEGGGLAAPPERGKEDPDAALGAASESTPRDGVAVPGGPDRSGCKGGLGGGEASDLGDSGSIAGVAGGGFTFRGGSEPGTGGGVAALGRGGPGTGAGGGDGESGAVVSVGSSSGADAAVAGGAGAAAASGAGGAAVSGAGAAAASSTGGAAATSGDGAAAPAGTGAATMIDGIGGGSGTSTGSVRTSGGGSVGGRPDAAGTGGGVGVGPDTSSRGVSRAALTRRVKTSTLSAVRRRMPSRIPGRLNGFDAVVHASTTTHRPRNTGVLSESWIENAVSRPIGRELCVATKNDVSSQNL